MPDTIEQFAKRLKEKFPDYAEIDDFELTERVVRKYPVYASHVDLPKEFKLLKTSSGYAKLDDLYEQAGREHNVDPNLLLEQARQETINFKPDVMYGRQNSPAGARGAGQFMAGTAPTYGLKVDNTVDERTDPVKSVGAQAKYMRKLLDDFNDDENLALAGYNAGEHRQSLRQGRVPNIRETQEYVRIIGEKLKAARSGQSKSLRELYGTPVQSAAPVTEAPETIEAQAISAIDANGPRAAVLLTQAGQEKLLDPAILKSFKQVQTPNGLLLVNARKAKSLGVTDYQKDLTKLIGKVEDHADTTSGAFVRTEDAGGNELATSKVSSMPAAQRQVHSDLAQFPGAAQSALVNAQDAIARRIGSDPMHPGSTARDKYAPQPENLPQDYREYLQAGGLQDSSEARAEFNRIMQANVESVNQANQAAVAQTNAENQAAQEKYRRDLAEHQQRNPQQQSGTITRERQVGTATDSTAGAPFAYNLAPGDEKLSDEQLLRKALPGNYGITSQNLDAWIAKKKAAGGKLIAGRQPDDERLPMSWADIEDITGESQVPAIRQEQAEAGRITPEVSREMPGTLPESKAEQALDARIKETDYSIQKNLGDKLSDPASWIDPYIGWKIFGEPSEDWVAEEKSRLRKEHGSFSKAWEAEQYYQNATPVEKAVRVGSQITRSFAKNLAGGTAKTVLFVGDQIEKVLAVNAFLPDEYKVGTRNAGNILDFVTRLTFSKDAQTAINESRKNWVKGGDLSQQQLFKAAQEFDKAVGNDPVLKGRFLGALGDAGGSALAFVAMGAVMPSIAVGRFNAGLGISGALQSAGPGYEEGKQSGLSEEDAIKFGAIQGLLGASEMFGAGAELAAVIKNPAIRRHLALGILDAAKKGAVREAKEEFFQEVFQTTGGKIALEYLKDKDPSTFAKIKNALNRLPQQIATTAANEGLIALITGGAMGGAGGALSAAGEAQITPPVMRDEAGPGKPLALPPGSPTPSPATEEKDYIDAEFTETKREPNARTVNVAPDGSRESRGLLGEDTPQRIEVADPGAVQRVGIDTRIGKVVEALKKQADFVDLDTLAKATRINRTNLEDAVMTLYGARLVELLPGNRVRLISEPAKTDLFEKAKTYGQTPAEVSQPAAQTRPSDVVPPPTVQTPSAPVTGTPKSPQSTVSTAAETTASSPTAQPNAAAPEYQGKTATNPASREDLTFTGEVADTGALIATNNFGQRRRIPRADADQWLAKQASAPVAEPETKVAENVAKPVKAEPRIERNFRAGTNDATLVFDSELQRDLYDYAANQRKSMRGGGQRATETRVKDLSDLQSSLAQRLGITPNEVYGIAGQVHDDVRAQMKGVQHLEERKVVDNITKKSEPDAESATSIEAPKSEPQPAPVKEKLPPRPKKSKYLDLTQFVRGAGGIKSTRWDKGEVRRISNKETGTTGLLNSKSGMGADYMAQKAWEAGYLRDVFPTYHDINPDKFLEALEADFTGQKKSYSREDIDAVIDEKFESEYKKWQDDYAEREQTPEAREEYHRKQDDLLTKQIGFLNNADSQNLLAKVSEQAQYDDEGNVTIPDEKLRREYYDALDRFGIEPYIHADAILEAHREALAERESPSTRNLDEVEPQGADEPAQTAKQDRIKAIDEDIVTQQFEDNAGSFYEDAPRTVETPDRIAKAANRIAEPPERITKQPNRPTLHGVPPQELTPLLTARVLYEKDKGTPASDIAEKYNLTPEQVASVGELPAVGSGGQMAHKIIQRMIPAKQATAGEIAEKIAFVNDMAAEMGVDARLTRDAKSADIKNASDAIRMAIAKEAGKTRSSEMDQADWLKFLDTHADKLQYESIAAVLDAFDHQSEHTELKVKPFVRDKDLIKIVEDLEASFGLHNVRSYRDLPTTIRQKIRRIGYSYGLRQTALERAFSQSFLDQSREKFEEGRNRPTSSEASEKGEKEPVAERPRQEEELAPAEFTVDPNDIPYETAYRAYTNVSFSPEKRARQIQQGYVDDVTELYTQLSEIAETPEQKAILDSEIDRYKKNYVEKEKAIIAATARTANPMVTGPANFPADRNRKRMDTEQKRVSEFLEWKPKAEKAIREKILQARTPEAIAEERWQEFKVIIDRVLNKGFSRTLLANRIERLANNGQVELVDKSLDYIRAAGEKAGKPIYTAKHRIWTLPEVAAKKASATPLTGTDTIAEYEGVKVVNNKELERVQLMFDARPSPETIRILKKNGWRWSPSNSAWQRQNTQNGINNAPFVLKQAGFAPSAQPESPTTTDKPDILFTQTDLFGNTFNLPEPVAKQASLFEMAASPMEGQAPSDVQTSIGKQTADFLASLQKSPDKSIVKAAATIADRVKFAASKGATQVIEDAADALDLYSRAVQTKSPIEDMFRQGWIGGDVEISDRTKELARAMDAGAFGRVLNDHLSKANTSRVIPDEAPVRADNPFWSKAAAARRAYEKASRPSAHEKGMEESFPLGGGYGRKGAEKRLESSLNRAVGAQELLKKAEWLEAQAELFDEGKINAQGRPPAANAEEAKAKRLSRKEETEQARQAREGKENWEVTQDVYLKSSQYRTGSGAELVKYDHEEAVREAVAAGKPVPAEVLVDYPDLQPNENPLFSKAERNKLRRHFNRTKPTSYLQMLRDAKFTQNKDTGITEMNEAALDSMIGAFQGMKVLGEGGGILGAAFDAPNLTHFKEIWGNAVQVTANQGMKRESRELQRVLDDINKFTHPDGVIGFAYVNEKFPEVTKFTVQEETGHLADIRAAVTGNLVETGKGYAKAQEHLRGQDYEERMIHREITGKLQRDDAPDALGIPLEQVEEMQALRLMEFYDAGITTEKYLDLYGKISDTNKRQAELYAKFTDPERTRTDEPTERGDQRPEPRYSRDVRPGVDNAREAAATRTRPRPDESVFRRASVLSASQRPNESLISPAERQEIAKHVPGLDILFSRAEPLTKNEATFWNTWIKNKRETEIPQIIVNFRRSGLLTGFKTHLRNMVSNAANQVSEEAIRIPAFVADLAASGFTGERSVQPPSPTAIYRSLRSLVAADKTLTELDQESGIARAWNIIKNGSVEELRKNQVEEMRSGLPLLDTFINGTFRLLGAEDALFKTYAMRRSLEAQARTMAITEAKQKLSKHTSIVDRQKFISHRQDEILKNPEKGMLLEAMIYADFTTYTNNNPISDWFSKVKDLSKGGKAVLETIVPYDRTPTNIVLRTLEHTPAGFVWAGKHLSDRKKGTSYTFERLRQDYLDDFERLDANREAARKKFDQKFKEALRGIDAEIKTATGSRLSDLQNEKTKIQATWKKVKGKRSLKDSFREADREELEAMLKKVFPRVQQMMFANSIGRASLGSSVILLGMYFAANGLMSGLWDAGDEDEQDEFFERRERGILNGSLKVGSRRYQINDSPTGKAMVLGASLWERSQREPAEGQGKTGKALSDFWDVGGNLVMEQPLLGSLNDYFGKNKTAEKRLGALLGSFVPTIVADIADVADKDARRNSRILDATMNRIPGLRQQVPKGRYPREPHLQNQRNRIVSKFDPTSSRPVER